MNIQAGPLRRLATTVALVSVVTVAPAVAASGPTQVKPGFNLFKPEQDIAVGRQAAQQAERQMPILRDRTSEQYVSDIMRNLAQYAPGAKYPYQAHLVNSKDINAFALPGGFLYVNRGTIEAAADEGQLAGVIAHEMAHVALRHGTHQVSKAYAAQAGLGVLGGVVGLGRGGNANAQIVNAVGGLGMSALFLKYSRDAETDADIVGAQMLAKAGYDPMEMVSFFETLERQRKGSTGGVAQFLSDHPAPKNRADRIRKEAELLGPVQARASVGDFQSVRAELQGLAPAPSSQQIARGDYRQSGSRGGNSGRYPTASGNRYPSQDSRYPDDSRYPPQDDGRYPDDSRYPQADGRYPDDSRYPQADGRYPDDGDYPAQTDARYPQDDNRYPDDSRYPAQGDGRYPARNRSRASSSRYPGRGASIEQPSQRMQTYRQRNGSFAIEYPDNWRVYDDGSGKGVTLAPQGGIVDNGAGEQSIVYGVMLNRYDPLNGTRGRVDLQGATDDLAQEIMSGNRHLRLDRNARRAQGGAGSQWLSLGMSGRSPLTGEDERVTLYTRELQNGQVAYALFVAPSREYGPMDRTFSQMVESLRIDDVSARR